MTKAIVSIEFIEAISSFQAKNKILLLDINKNDTLLNKTYNDLLYVFSNEIVDHDNRNNNSIILTLGIVSFFQLDFEKNQASLNTTFSLKIFTKSTLFNDVNNNNPIMINNAWEDYQLEEMLFLYSILFDQNEEECS